MKTFYLQRDEDETGISGTGKVAEGVVFANRKVVLTWLTDVTSIVMYESIADVEHIHGHNGKTRVVYDSSQSPLCTCGCHTSDSSDAEMKKNGCDVCYEVHSSQSQEDHECMSFPCYKCKKGL